MVGDEGGLMINYTEKGYGLHEAIKDAGHFLRQENGEWVSSNDTAVQAIIDGFSISDAANFVSGLIDDKAKSLRDKFSKKVSASEMAAWASKKLEADKFQVSKNNADAPTLVIEAGFRGVTVQNLVNKVISNFDTTSQRESRISGVAGKHKDAVKSLASFSAINSYDFSTDWPNG